jgi:lysophospholipase L1-like esterase
LPRARHASDDRPVSGVYVALGDSMSIDAYAGGTGRGAASLLYRNRDEDFPDWVGKDLAGAGLSTQLLAFDGATSTDVVCEQLPMITGVPALVTITVGGNDLMSVYGNTSAAYAAVDQVASATDEILTRLRCNARCQLVVTTVYDPSDGTGYVPGAALPPWPDGSAAVRALNTELTRLAQRHAAVVADVHATFHGHGVTSGDPAQPEPRPANTDLWYCGVIEPNAWGSHHIRATWWHALRDAGWQPQRP